MTNEIAEVLDAPTSECTDIIEAEIVEHKTGTLKPTDQEIIDDFNYARETLKGLIEKGGKTLNQAVKFAEETPQPRAFEVTSTLLGQVSTLAHDLMRLSKTAAEIDKAKTKPIGKIQNTTNNITVTQEELCNLMDESNK